jgi:hypothetical protein
VRWDHARWWIACHDEVTRIDQYGTRRIVRRHEDLNGVDTKWVLHIKNPGTDQERYTAHVVTRASVVKFTMIWILWSLAAALGTIVELANVVWNLLNETRNR